MAPILILLLLSILSTLFICPSHAQDIFINQVPEYSLLGTCAEPPLSSIVRDMYSGCGDGTQTTSYDCFCSQSSSQFDSIISKAIVNKCPSATADATSALEVFASYCQLGDAISSTTANATAATTSARGSAAESASSSHAGISTGVRITIAVLVPLIILASCICIYFFMRRRAIIRRNDKKTLPPGPPSDQQFSPDLRAYGINKPELPGIAVMGRDKFSPDSTVYGKNKPELPGFAVMGRDSEMQQVTVLKSENVQQLGQPVELTNSKSVVPAELEAGKARLLS
jgi:hypothetical protein